MTAKRLGIWMDHSSANLIEFTRELIETKTIESTFTHEAKDVSRRKGENHMHSKEQHEMIKYFNTLGEAIKKCEEVILFGPTDAKVQLFNYLTKDHHFDNVKIIIAHADKMTDNQQRAFVRAHFSTH